MGLLQALQALQYGVPAWQLAAGVAQPSQQPGFGVMTPPGTPAPQLPQAQQIPDWTAFAQPQQQQPQRAPQARPAASPALPSLTGAPNGMPLWGPENAMAPQAPAAKVAPEGMKPPYMKDATPSPGQGGWMGGFGKGLNSAIESPLFQLGMSLMGNATSPEQWGGVGRDLRDFTQQRRQQQVIDNETRRQKTGDARDEAVLGRQQTQWGNEDQQRRDWQAAVAREADPQRRAMLQALGPESYGQWMAGEQQREFQAREGQLDRDVSIRGQNMAAANAHDPRERFQYQADFRRLAEMGTAANFGQQYVVPRLNRAEQIITRLAQLGGMSSPLDANRRIQLSQLGQFGGEARGLLQELQRIQTQFTVEDARALAPVSNTDFGRLQEINPNGNMTIDAAYRIVNTMRSEVQRGLDNYSSASRWFDQNNGLTGTLDPGGRTFEQVQGEAYRDAGRDPAAAPSPQGQGQQQAPAAAPVQRAASLPSPRGLEDGTTARDSVTGREFEVRNGQWQPRGQAGRGVMRPPWEWGRR